MEKENVIVEKSLKLAISIVSYCELLEEKRRFVVANQLLRCGTSVGANISEAQHAESRADFIHKMKIAVKEANETCYWLTICSNCAGYPDCRVLKESTEEVIRILSRIIYSAKAG